jgi:hypothetical protein
MRYRQPQVEIQSILIRLAVLQPQIHKPSLPAYSVVRFVMWPVFFPSSALRIKNFFISERSIPVVCVNTKGKTQTYVHNLWCHHLHCVIQYW